WRLRSLIRVFFFSSRRRHTRFSRDWSSDVCSSDLGGWFMYVPLTDSTYSPGLGADFWLIGVTFAEIAAVLAAVELIVLVLINRRSEERRVGNDWTGAGSPAA